MDSNDRLYGCDKKFLAEISHIVSTLMEAVFEHLKSLTSDEVSAICPSVVLMSLNQSQFKNSRFEDTKITDEIRTKAGLESGGVLSYLF